MTYNVADAVEALRLAMITPERNTLLTLTHPALSYGHSSGKVETRQSFVDTLLTGESVFTAITLSDQTIDLIGNIATVRHKMKAETNDKGRGPGSIGLGILLIWYKDGKHWQLIARQAYRV